MNRQQVNSHKTMMLAFIEGKDIEYSINSGRTWLRTVTPSWGLDINYRIRPDKKVLYAVYHDDGSHMYSDPAKANLTTGLLNDQYILKMVEEDDDDGIST